VVRKANVAFMKPLQPSEALGKVVGTKPIPRTEVVKKLWVYIKKNDLQDKKNRGREFEGCVWRQSSSVDVRHDKARLKAPLVINVSFINKKGGLLKPPFLFLSRSTFENRLKDRPIRLFFLRSVPGRKGFGVRSAKCLSLGRSVS